MIGKNIFEDMGIDAYEVEVDMKARAESLVNEWGSKLTEGDLLQLNAMVNSNSSNAENSIAAYALEYYLTKNYKPEFIHAVKTPLREKPWWKFW